MKTNDDYLNEAINKHIGKVAIGDVVAHRSHRLAHTLIDIVGDIGICNLPDGTINQFPVDELFEPNKVRHTAFSNKILDNLLVDRNN